MGGYQHPAPATSSRARRGVRGQGPRLREGSGEVLKVRGDNHSFTFHVGVSRWECCRYCLFRPLLSWLYQLFTLETIMKSLSHKWVLTAWWQWPQGGCWGPIHDRSSPERRHLVRLPAHLQATPGVSTCYKCLSVYLQAASLNLRVQVTRGLPQIFRVSLAMTCLDEDVSVGCTRWCHWQTLTLALTFNPDIDMNFMDFYFEQYGESVIIHRSRGCIQVCHTCTNSKCMIVYNDRKTRRRCDLQHKGGFNHRHLLLKLSQLVSAAVHTHFVEGRGRSTEFEHFNHFRNWFFA